MIEELFLVLELREKKFTFAIHKGGKMKIFLFICRPFFWAQHRIAEGDSFGSRAQWEALVQKVKPSKGRGLLTFRPIFSFANNAHVFQLTHIHHGRRKQAY